MKYIAQIQAVIELLAEIEATGAPADNVASQFFRYRRYIGAGDRRVISALAFKVLRHQGKLNWWASYMGLSDVQKPRRQTMLGLIFLEGVPPKELDEIFSSEEYGPTALTSLEMYALEKFKVRSLDHKEMPEHIRLDLPEWAYLRLKAVFGEDLDAEVEALNQQAPLDLRINTLKVTKDHVLHKFNKLGWDVEETKLSPLGLRMNRGKPLTNSEMFKNGSVEVQDEGSQIVSLLCDAQPGQAVLDMCAGAGGKTLVLASTMQNKGRLLATDVHEHRLTKAKLRLRKAGVNNHEIKVLDENANQWFRRQTGRFDRVLIDVPCSGSGTWRRNPDLKNRFNENDLNELVEKQREIMENAYPLLKSGGVLVYATCSLYREENEDQIENFLRKHPEFEILPVPEVWERCVGGSCPVTTDMLRLSPFKNHTDGFFTALLKKK
ncbi:MAG: RsmB/NOP family class I SAM-dependent RNA methyltransferase [Alphaproteobacteria bacterium]|nr:RsmB/NOP family class I SAM-dependent RNA methyltransferase [Alphaproteobacteria bacterium]